MGISAVTNELKSDGLLSNFNHSSSTYSNQFNHNHKNVEEKKKDFTKILITFLVARSLTYIPAKCI